MRIYGWNFQKNGFLARYIFHFSTLRNWISKILNTKKKVIPIQINFHILSTEPKKLTGHLVRLSTTKKAIKLKKYKTNKKNWNINPIFSFIWFFFFWSWLHVLTVLVHWWFLLLIYFWLCIFSLYFRVLF